MSTTTRRRRLGWPICLGAVLAAWFALVVAFTALAEPTRDVVVIGSPTRVSATASIALIDSLGGSVRVRGLAPGFVAELYANGALLVLPARAGCLGGAARAL